MANHRRNKRSNGNLFDQNPEALKKLKDKMNGQVKNEKSNKKDSAKASLPVKKKKSDLGNKRNSISTNREQIKPISEEILDDIEKIVQQSEKKRNWRLVEEGISVEKSAKDKKSREKTGYYGIVKTGVGGNSNKEFEYEERLIAHNNTNENSRSNKKDRAYIGIGIDFGTSCSKVVFSAPYMRRWWAVPFYPHSESIEMYLQQTVIYVAPDDQVSLEPQKNSHKFGDLKLLLLEDEDKVLLRDETGKSLRLKELSACYIALLLKKARRWFEESYGNLFTGREIIWHLNVGMPAKNYDDEDLYKRFLKLARVGWYLSQLDIPITVSRAIKAWEKAHFEKFEPGGIEKEDINVVPEVAAEVAGYARSAQRDEGLHLLVDVGAGTLDISTFLLNSFDGDDRYDFMAADVSSHGCIVLHRRRVEELILAFNELIENENQGAIENLSSPIPDSIEELLPVNQDVVEKLQEGYEKGNTTYADECVGAVASVVKYTRNKRDPYSTVWKGKLPIFLCGGGSHLHFYQDVIDKTRERLRPFISGWQGFDLMELPLPDRLKADHLGPEHYHRIAVAYGLSFPYDQIGEIIPPSEISSIEKEPVLRKTVSAPISKDMV